MKVLTESSKYVKTKAAFKKKVVFKKPILVYDKL